MNKQAYTRILINRTDLFATIAVGFVAQRIGDLRCEGWVLTERLPMMTTNYRLLD
jgi:hypothetical protein